MSYFIVAVKIMTKVVVLLYYITSILVLYDCLIDGRKSKQLMNRMSKMAIISFKAAKESNSIWSST